MLNTATLAINRTKKLINSISLAIWIIFRIVVLTATTIVAAQLCHFSFIYN